MKTVIKINESNSIDLCVLNGDYLDNNNTSKATVAEWYKMLDKTFSGLSVPQWRGKGNHDANDANINTSEHLTNEDYYKYFMRNADINKFIMPYGKISNCYGYYDDTNKKIRFIFINTVDIPNGYEQQHIKGISNEQLNFVADALKFNDSEWGVVFISHHALQDNRVLNPDEHEDAYLTPEHGGIPLIGVINAFINNRSTRITLSNNKKITYYEVPYFGYRSAIYADSLFNRFGCSIIYSSIYRNYSSTPITHQR